MSNKKIAFIDDEPFWRNNVRQLLEFDGYDVDTFTDGGALESPGAYLAIISDGRLAFEKQGIEELVRLKKAGFKGHLVLYTNLPRDRDLSIAAEQGFEVFRKSEVISDVVAQLKLG